MKKPKVRIKKLSKPPTSKRFCIYAKERHIWEYNRNIFHSECTVCGGRGVELKK